MERRQLLRTAGGLGAVSIGGYGYYRSVTPSWEPREGGILSGVVPASWQFSRLDSFETWLGQHHAVVGLFVDVGTPNNVDTIVRENFERVWERRQVPHVYWQPFFGGRDATSPNVAREIAAGEHDTTLETWAETLADWAVRSGEPDRRMYLNFAPELTGDWVPWSPAVGAEDEFDFVRMWRRVHGIVMNTALTADHVQWIWTLDTTNRGVDVRAAYPGDKYVDWVGVHGYNWTGWEEWRSPRKTYGPVIDTVRSITDQPVGVTEFGCSAEVDGNRYDPAKKEEWIRDAYAFFRAGDVKMALWFNLETDADWTVFGGTYGHSAVSMSGETYNAYPAYRGSITDDAVLSPHPEHPRVLVDEEFTGDF